MRNGIVIAIFFVSQLFLLSCQSAQNKKTNVVFILIDDLSHYGVSAYGADRVSTRNGAITNVSVSTPQIDNLAKEGLLFENAYISPLCETSRISLMSGKVNARNYLRCKSQHASDITFGDVFQRAGYATGMFGKWKQTRGTNDISGKDYIYEFGWDEFCCFDVTMEGQRFINPNLVVNGVVANYNGRTNVDPETGRRWYGPDICNRNALQFIDKNKDKPFFLYYSMLLVHDDHKPTPDTKPNSLFDNFDEANHNRNGHTGDDIRYFPDMVRYMDKLIGNVVAKLDEHDLRENTLIVVMGDNGTKECFIHMLPNGKEYPGRKGGTADNGIHVPLVFNQPGTIENIGLDKIRKYNGLVDATDIFPTLCEAVGIEIPRKEELDGISFWPQVLGVEGEHREVIYRWYNGNNLHTDTSLLLQYAFNKYFKRYAPSEEHPNGRFFDLRTDSLELQGDGFAERKWGLRLYDGLDLNKLTLEQQKAYDYLGTVIDSYQYRSVDSIKIISEPERMVMGESVQLNHSIFPTTATRNNVIWYADSPEIVSVDKFGVVKAHKKGKVTITLYSWDDAYPLSANESITFNRGGLKDSVLIIVE